MSIRDTVGTLKRTQPALLDVKVSSTLAAMSSVVVMWMIGEVMRLGSEVLKVNLSLVLSLSSFRVDMPEQLLA